MKKTTLLSAMLVAGFSILPAGVGAQTFEDVTNVVTMTTEKAVGEEISITMNQGSFLIDWGNGEVQQVESTGEAITGKVQGTKLIIGSNNFSTLDCSSCGLSDLTLKANDLSYLDCSNNELTELYLQGMSKLEVLDCSDNVLSTLYIAATTKKELKELDCSNNKLTTLSVSDCQNLRILQCYDNELTTLALTGVNSLNTLWCHNNSLASLNMGACVNIESVVCSNNKLTSLTPSSSSTSIIDFWCNDNQLTSLSLQGNIGIETISCANNKLKNLTLPVKANGELLAAYLQNNFLGFSDLYATSAAVDYVYGPQGKFTLSKQLINVNESVEIPENDKNVNGQVVNPDVFWYDAKTEYELEEGSRGDYTSRSNSYTFLKPFESVYCKMYCGLYPGLELVSEPLTVVDPSTGVDQVNKGNGFVCYGHGGQLVMSAQKSCEAKVYATDGKLVWTGTVGTTPVTLNLPSGVYVVNGVKIYL